MNASLDLTVRREVLQQEEFFHNGIGGEAATLYADRAHSLALAVTLGLLIKKRGLGSVGAALILREKEPVSAFTAVGFTPKDRSASLTVGEGTGVLLGVEGAALCASWPKPHRTGGEAYRTFWLPIDNTLPVWRKLGRFFPQEEWKSGASEVAEALLSAHREALGAHWIPLGGAGS